MIMDTVWLLLMVTGATLLGARVLSRWPFTWDGWVERGLLSAGLGLLIYSYTMTAASVVGGLYSWVAYLLLGIGFLSGRRLILAMWHRRHELSIPRFPVASLWLFLALLPLIGMNYASAVSPLLGGSGSDDVTYQLAVPKVFTAYHRFVLLPENIRSFLPLNINMLYLFSILLGNTEVAKLLNFAFGLGLFGITYHMARRYVSRNVALLAGLICYTNPLTSHNGSLAYIGLGLAFYFTLTMYALLTWKESGDGKWLTLSALFLGFSIGSQYLGLLYLGAALPLFLISPRRWSIGAMAKFVSLVVLLAAPWYVKNWIVTGTPLYPLFPQWVTNTELAEIAQMVPLRGENPYTREPSVIGLLTLPWSLMMRGNWFAFWGGMGHLFFIYIPLYVLWGFRRSSRNVRFLLISAIFLLILWYGGKSNGIRYLITIVPALSVVTAAAISLCSTRPLVYWSTLGTLLIYIMFGLIVNWKENKEWFPYVTSSLSKREYLMRRVEYYSSGEFLNRLPPKSTTVLICGSVFPIYLDVRSIGPHRKAYSPFTAGIDETPWLRTPLIRLQRLGITHVLDGTDRFLILRQAQHDAAHFREVFTDKSIHVYEVRY